MERAKKLSVSVPSDLWDEATFGAAGGLTPSEVVQAALREFVKPENKEPVPSYDAPDDIQDRFQEVKRRFVEDARDEYQRGYRGGLDLADAMPWRELEDVAVRARFDVYRWLREHVDSEIEESMSNPNRHIEESDRRLGKALLQTLGGLVPTFGEGLPVPGPVYMAGFTQALRDLWDEVAQANGELPF